MIEDSYAIMNPVVVFLAVTLVWVIWYIYDRYHWYSTVIKNNPKIATLQPVATQTMVVNGSAKAQSKDHDRVVAPGCNLKQYLKYLQLACLPYAWSVPVKFLKELYSRQFKSNLSEYQKRQRLAKMVLETSLVLGFNRKENDVYIFRYQCFRIPSRQNPDCKFHVINDCAVNVIMNKDSVAVLKDIIIDELSVSDLSQMFSFLNTLWCVYTHTLTHIQAGNIAEVNLNEVQPSNDFTDDFKESIDDMHAAVSGMNESANHYPADIWGIPRKQLQIILGHNGVQQISNHQNIMQCYSISKFVNFTVKARKVFSKYLSDTGISISTLSANTIFHSIDHYNMGKYFLHESEEKKYHGIDARMITSLLGDLNYDLGGWQTMKYTKYTIWQSIYQELNVIDEELADKVHMFVSV